MDNTTQRYRYNLYYIFEEDKKEHPPDLERMETTKLIVMPDYDGYP